MLGSNLSGPVHGACHVWYDVTLLKDETKLMTRKENIEFFRVSINPVPSFVAVKDCMCRRTPFFNLQLEFVNAESMGRASDPGHL